MNNGDDYPDLPEVRMIPAKERWAIQIAQGILQAFKGMVGGMLIGGILIVAICMHLTKGDADLTTKIMREAVTPFVKEVGTFAATVFGPLLAFILGHYFGKGPQ